MNKNIHWCPKCHSSGIISNGNGVSCILCGYAEQDKGDESPVPITNDVLVLSHKHKRK